MLDQLVQTFLRTRDEHTAVSIMRFCRCSSLCDIGICMGKYFSKLFPNSYELLDEYGLCYYFNQNHRKCYDIYTRILSMQNLTEDLAKRALFNAHFCINHISNDYSYYNKSKVQKLTQRTPQPFPLITLSVTSCKRLDLFEQTINSFINCCEDIDRIDKWLCVDDNSSPEDRKRMQELYPFFEFYFKKPEEKGHPQSMNIIRQKVDTPYLFHMEDDWKFYHKRKYLSDCFEVLQQNPKIGQCLVNKNYAETERDIQIVGGHFNTTKSGLRYYIHEFSSNHKMLTKFHEKYGTGVLQCSYWPYFSFRPSLIKTKIFEELGEFNETVSHFEMDYCSKYTDYGYISAFLEGIYSMHIGRLTSERNDKSKPNAYELNDEVQFEGKEERNKDKAPDVKVTPPSPEKTSQGEEDEFEEIQVLSLENTLPEDIKMETFVVNLDKRKDRMRSFHKKAKDSLKFLGYYNRYPAVDGMKLVTNPQLQRIFDGNDYNMRRGMVGCAMSHISLYVDLLNSEHDMYMIIEDDVSFTRDFGKKMLFCFQQLKGLDWDMLYLGHHLRKEYITDSVYNQDLMPHLEKWDTLTSLQRSLGGTGGYIITKAGAKRLLDFIDKYGMTNGIDTVQQKSADDLDIYYTSPHLILAECWRGDNNVDTDIQYDYSSLTRTIPDRLEDERSFYTQAGRVFVQIESVDDIENDKNKIYYSQKLLKTDLPHYTLNNEVTIIVPQPDRFILDNRYFSRVKKGEEYTVEDALVCKN